MTNCECREDRGTLCRLCRTLNAMVLTAKDLDYLGRVGDALKIMEIVINIRREQVFIAKTKKETL